MGTNYYLKNDPCPHCGRSDDRRHIGKSSGGWTFALRVYPDEGINTLEDWKPLFASGAIEDEYGDDVSCDEMLSAITERTWDRKGNPAGYQDLADWCRQNSAEPGPNGLARHKIDGSHCTGHGDGTWDYLPGEFS